MSRSVFLRANWRYLLMANYAIDPALLVDHCPAGVEIDRHDGETFVSLVGFLFLDTRVMRVPIPGHRDFEELNLRFYVRRQTDGGLRRGVAFIAEIVPRRAIAWVARTLYNESYLALPMDHRVDRHGDRLAHGSRVSYRFFSNERWQEIAATVTGQCQDLAGGSFDQFIAEHYWGYARQKNGGTVEYRVDHPPWPIWRATDFQSSIDVSAVYGPAFVEPLSKPPRSIFIADGSAIAVHHGERLR
ncbi:MAG: DUF2071 domain-containing protein [Myxococcales bacterium]|nr:DUF2071 domain-containing protein [Myxococcales bacterium]